MSDIESSEGEDRPLGVLRSPRDKLPAPAAAAGVSGVSPPSVLSDAPSFERSRERLRVVLHRAAALPAMDSDGFSDPYCVLRLASSTRSFESKCVRNTLDPVWEETFEFALPPGSRDSDALRIDVFDRDWVLGVPLKPDYIGDVVIDLSGVGAGIDKQWFPLRNIDGGLYQDARVQVSMQFVAFEMVEHGDAFWKMLSTNDEGHGPAALLRRHRKRADSPVVGVALSPDKHQQVLSSMEDDPQQMEVLKALFPLLRPIINNMFRFLYVVVRPFMLFLLWHRRILMDWEKPGMTVLLTILYYWAWYHNVLTSFMFFYLFGWVVVIYATARSEETIRSEGNGGETATAGALAPRSAPVQLNTSEMLEAYKRTKAELFYGELDPLAKDLETLEAFTRNVCESAEQYRDNMFFYFDRRVLGGTVGLLVVFGLICFVFSSIVDDLLFWTIRVVTFTLYFRCTILLPVSWRYPSLFPTIITFLLRPFRNPLRSLRVWLRRRTQLRELTRAEEAIESQRSVTASRSMTKALWETLQKEIGRKMSLRKGQLLEEPGTVSHFVYFLIKGKVESRPPGSASVSVGTMLTAPCSLFVANVLLAHGVVTHSVTAVVNSKLMVFDVADLRRYFEKHSALAEKFFLDLAVELATEVKLALTKTVHDVEREAETEENNESSASTSTATSSITTPRRPMLDDKGKGKTESSSVDMGFGVPPSLSAPIPAAAAAAVAAAKHPLSQTADFFSMRALDEDAPDKVWRFFQDTFGVTVKRDQLKVFDKGLWTKKGWSRFPGRVFLTPHHIAFWSQVGKKTLLGAASRGAGAESWIVPLEAIQTFSLHVREGHVKLAIDASNSALADLEQHSVVLELSAAARKKKNPSVKIYSDDQTQLTELRRSIELALSRRNVEEAVGESNVAGKMAVLSALVSMASTPILGGVELTFGTLHVPDLEMVKKKRSMGFVCSSYINQGCRCWKNQPNGFVYEGWYGSNSCWQSS